MAPFKVEVRDNKGHFENRGFLGRYEITAALNGKQTTVTYELTKNGEPCIIKLSE
ncbi:MAG: hypothetical protein QGG64_20410 [Candidatus Latescibacteria bacterium]|nr:hypothetical protein [Candidatus Latescibacterota bacterium]